MQNYRYITETIKDKHFYYMIENQIRDVMPKFEVGICLSKAKKILKDCNISNEELVDYPIEGYYYKSDALKEYFTTIRNFQHNTNIFNKIQDSDELLFLQNLTSSEIWGELKKNTATFKTVFDFKNHIFSPKKAPYNEENPPLIRRYDILTLTMEDSELFDLSSARPWTIDSIKNGLKKHYKARPNLVELAYLTGETECLLCGAETNSLYRMYAVISGCCLQEKQYNWDVSKEVEELGHKIIQTYNALIGSNMIVPNIYNHTTLKKEPELPRVALLGKIYLTDENYFWIMESNGFIREEYTKEFLTTEKLIEKEKSGLRYK